MTHRPHIVSWLRDQFTRFRLRLSGVLQRILRGVLTFGRQSVRTGRWLLDHREALSVPARFRAFRWIDRPLARILRTDPRMLSSRVALERVPFKGSVSERIRLWLWERHSVRSCIWLAILLSIGLCLTALGVALVIDVPMLGPRVYIDGIPSMLIATAGYGGAIFGFLQAVTIFAVQLRSQQDTSMLPLVPLIARRYFTFLILGSVAGVTIANLIASFAAPVLPVSRSALAALTWINLLAVPAVTLSAFWYLAAIVSEIGDADMDIALPVLRATMRAQALADIRKITLLNAYGSALERAGIKCIPFAESRLDVGNKSIERIEFTKSGVVHDLDCIRLQRVGILLRQVSPPPEALVAVVYGQTIQKDDALILAWDSSRTPISSGGAPAISNELRRQIRTALNSSHICAEI